MWSACLIYGGKGALGNVCVKEFKKKGWVRKYMYFCWQDVYVNICISAISCWNPVNSEAIELTRYSQLSFVHSIPARHKRTAQDYGHSCCVFQNCLLPFKHELQCSSSSRSFPAVVILQRVLSVDLVAHEEADGNVVLVASHSWTDQARKVDEGVAAFLTSATDKLTAVMCVAGGWAGKWLRFLDISWYFSRVYKTYFSLHFFQVVMQLPVTSLVVLISCGGKAFGLQSLPDKLLQNIWRRKWGRNVMKSAVFQCSTNFMYRREPCIWAL